MGTDQKVIDAIRTVGQLLLHNSTTGTFARNSAGNPVDLHNPNACKFCYNGAIGFVAKKMAIHYTFLHRQCDNITVGHKKYFGWVHWDRVQA